MEELALKLAQLLDVSVEAAVELYPVIRGQFQWYSLLEQAGNFNFIYLMVLIIATMIWLMKVVKEWDEFLFYSWDYRKENKEELEIKNKERNRSLLKPLKYFIAGWVLFFAVWVGSVIAVHFLAPDIILIKGLLG